MNRAVIHAERGTETISRNIYGHFAEHLGRCIHEGIWVGEDSTIPHTRGIRNDVVRALRAVNIPVLRWPGGCFADEYHWTDGIGPKSDRPTMVNTHWGGVTENNHFGTHEFMDLCVQLGCEPYVCGNVGSGTVREMQQWVEYLTFDGRSPAADLRRRNGRADPWKVRYWGVGNENWGCGGNMRPEYYADEYRRYQTYLRNFGENRLYKIACGPNGPDYAWTETLMSRAGWQMNGLSLHYYTWPDKKNGADSATEFGEKDWYTILKRTLEMDDLITRHSGIMDRHDPDRRVGLIVDEWGTWYRVEPGTDPGFLYQQNTIRDAVAAALNFHVFHRHCARVKMANIAQTVNVLQAMILTDGPRMILTPTYHAFEMYRVHQDATLLPLDLECGTCGGDAALPVLSATASRNREGIVHVSLCNLSADRDTEVEVVLQGTRPAEAAGRILTGSSITAHNTFDSPDAVEPHALESVRLAGERVTVAMPARSVVTIRIG